MFFKKIFMCALCTGIFGNLFASDYEKEEEMKFQVWQGRYHETPSLVPDISFVTENERNSALARLNGNEKPSASNGEVYLADSPYKKSNHSSEGENIAYVGQNRMNYVQRSGGPLPSYEAFCSPDIENPKLKRKEPEYLEIYSIEKEKMVTEKVDRRSLKADSPYIFFDAGHGVDHAKTITYKGSNSSWDPQNYTPQNAYYNRYIRSPLVKFATENNLTYKEMAIYDEKPLLITKESKDSKKEMPVPEGFIFFLIKSGSGLLEETYYFPNFQHYKKDTLSIPKKEVNWKYFKNKYALPLKIAEDIWGYNEVDSKETLRKFLNQSSHVGYRSLSGRYEVLPNDLKWPLAARNALVRTAAIYRIERAAEYDPSVENMLQVAALFNSSSFEFMEFQGTIFIPDLARYWTGRAMEEIKRKNYPSEDIFHLKYYERSIPLQPHEATSLINSFEENLLKNPNAEHITKLLQYLDEENKKDSYRIWSEHLSNFVSQGETPRSKLITKENVEDLTQTIADVDITNIILDFEMSSDNFTAVIAGLKKRALREKSTYEKNLNFLEIRSVKREQLEFLLNSFENGLKHEGQKLYVDVRGTSIKLPSYEKKSVKEYVMEKCPKTPLLILD